MRTEYWINDVIEAGLPVGRGDHPLRWTIADVLDEMDDFWSEPLRMWAWEGLTYREIAEELGLAGRQSGHERVRRALEVFKTLMEEIRDEGATNGPDAQRDTERELRGPEGSDSELSRQAG